ncbi:hypothetical protein PFISCL1PPCAC_21417, partial [Pristionchus fissidentatus]
TMQKRGRAVETQKLKRTMKSQRKTTVVREPTSNTLSYVKLCITWLCIMFLDVGGGVRFELLWPCWMLVRSFYESMQRRNAFINLGGQTTTFLFVCVTATSDLICYLFIPVRLLVFLATTYVWMNLVWHVNGGFLRTIATIFADKTQAAPVVFLWSYFVVFEIFCRMRCDYLIFLKYYPWSSWLAESEGCLHMQGMHPGFQQAFNAFFSAHCIGYPLIVISFNVKYYYKEWRLRRKQGDVSDRNESLFRLLADSIPMDFDATRLYRRADYLDDECLDDDYLDTTPSTSAIGDRSYLPIEPAPSLQQVQPQLLQQQQQQPTMPKLSSSANGTPGASPAENGHSSNGVVTRRYNGVRSSVSKSSSSRAAASAAAAANGTSSRGLQQPANGSSSCSGSQRRGEKEEKDEEGHEEWFDESSDAEVQLHRREAANTAPFIVRVLVAAATRFLLLFAGLVPFVGGTSVKAEEFANGKHHSSAHSTPNSLQQQQQNLQQHSTPPSRSAARKNNGVGGGRRVANGMFVDHSTSAANGRSRQENGRSNGLGLLHSDHHDAAAAASGRDISRESSRTQHSEESERSTGGGVVAAAAAGRICGVECGKLASECARLRSEVRQVRQAEEAARLHATNCSNGEKNSMAECSQMKGRIEQLINKISSIERQRDQERSTAAVAERKAAESAARAAELERELQKERVERREEREKGREKSETVSETQQLLREKEAAWERESERLRHNSRTKDEVIIEMQGELTKLRAIAKNAVEAEDLRAELSLLRDKNIHLEASLSEENKLKQELFRALRNTQAERDRMTRQFDYSAFSSSSPSSALYPLSPPTSTSVPPLGSPGSNGSSSISTHFAPPDPPGLAPLSCAASVEQAFGGGGTRHSYSFASPLSSTHTSSFLSSSNGEHQLFEPLPLPANSSGLKGSSPFMPDEDDGEPFYAQNCGKFGAPSPASTRTTTSS